MLMEYYSSAALVYNALVSGYRLYGYTRIVWKGYKIVKKTGQFFSTAYNCYWPKAIEKDWVFVSSREIVYEWRDGEWMMVNFRCGKGLDNGLTDQKPEKEESSSEEIDIEEKI